MLRKGMFLADRYEIIDQIGTGGMSDVYKAKCHKLNRFVAIKVLKKEFSEDTNFVSKFRIEAQSAAGLIHPNIVNVYDVGEENGIHYIVMELVEGITLKRYIEKKGKLASKEAVSIAIQVAQGIEAAHSHHIVHRDIKPQNIIISKEGKVKVTDFGIARAASSQTISSSAMGSVHYISPEQARGGYSDEKSDIYSFGITLYEMLTGTVPFDGDTTVAVAVQHIQDEIVPPSKVVDGIPISVDKIVMKCTQKKTDRRYQNVTDLIADLKKSLVMPDEDFVKMIPAYAAVDSLEETTAEAAEPAAEPELKMEYAAGGSLSDDILLDDDDLLDDEDYDDEDHDNPEILNEDDDESGDIEDAPNEKLDKIVKWIGVGIIAVIVLIAIFVVVKVVSSGKKSNNEQTTSSSTSANNGSTVAGSTVDTSNWITVPDVLGKTEEEAKKELNALGIGYKSTKQPSDTVAAGKVISQSTKGGTKIAPNSTITLSISEGTSTFALKSVVGSTEEEATTILKNLGLKVNIEYEWNTSVAQYNVISQTPVANSTVKTGDTVKIVVSRGEQNVKVAVPNLLGKTESEANQALDAVGLKSSVAAGQYSTTVAEGKIISQNYLEGTMLDKGSTVTITISLGKENTEKAVPNVVGKTRTEAKKTLEAAGFKVEMTDENSSTVASGNVISQSATTALDGATIKIVVSSGPKDADKDNNSGGNSGNTGDGSNTGGGSNTGDGSDGKVPASDNNN